ncbi:MAG: hypothetical protein ABSG02_15540 [Terriglobales bacterium]|jgi:hypothetical protein
MKGAFTILVLVVAVLSASGATDAYELISATDKTLLKPQVERWIRDQVKHDWSDLWEIQDQTREMKNSLLLGNKDAPDIDRHQYVQAMRATIGTGYPEIRAFTLSEVDKEPDGFQVVGCAKMRREEWAQTSIEYIHVRIVNGKALFGWPDGSPEPCKL